MAKTYNQFSLRQAAEFDRKTGQKDKLTGWGRISKERASKGISRRALRERRERE